ncbi:hypothetical protein QOZ80_5BG0416090 [Eleusine coracana subsp. coracana]|nr:hypothetical protein QOZ80_5BG0416090 [Eleusine coracana subsp. coracana]
MRKKLDTRFPAPRIKKIMQADEDVGKIALAVPVLVSKALELFLQDLCDRTYDITIRKGVKTVSSYHLKQCIQNYNVYDFLREVVSKVPDISSPDANVDDKFGKRKATEDGSEEEIKRTRNESESHTSNGRGRGRGDDVSAATEVEEATVRSSGRVCLRNFDLNLDPGDEDEVTVPSQTQSSAPTTSSAATTAGPSRPQLNEGATSAGPSAPQSVEIPKLKDFWDGNYLT